MDKPSCSSGGSRHKKRSGKTRKPRRGGGYGFGGALDGTTAGAKWGPDGQADAADPKTGAAIPDPALPKGGRRRKSRKGRKTRSRRRRTMRGGGDLVYNAGSVGAGFVGTGVGGLADYPAYAARTGGAPSNAAGVRTA